MSLIPARAHQLKVREPLINIYMTKHFRVKGAPTLVELYKLKMTLERAFKAGARKRELMMENLRWRGVAKVGMHTAIDYACILVVAITAHKIGRPDLANSIATFTCQPQKQPPSKKQATKELMDTCADDKATGYHIIRGET